MDTVPDVPSLGCPVDDVVGHNGACPFAQLDAGSALGSARSTLDAVDSAMRLISH